VREAGLQPGKDVLIVSVDAVDDALKAIVAGEINVSVELSPHLGGPAFDVINEFRAGKKDFEKWIRMGGAVYTADNAAAELVKRGAK
jgi:simple sugar transport system substrate-binding protein